MDSRIPTYEGGESYAFVSYAHADSDRVYPIIKRLADMGYRVWYDEGIPLVSDYGGVLYRHIRDCAAFIIFKSYNSVSSKDVELEISHAINFGKKIVQIVIDSKAEYPDSVAYQIPASRQYMHITAPQGEFYKKLAAQLEECRDPEIARREQEEARQRAEQEAAAKRAEEEAARRQAEQQAAAKRAEQEAARKRAEEEAARRQAEQQASAKRAKQEAERKRAEEEAARRMAEQQAAKERDREQAAMREANRDAAGTSTAGTGRKPLFAAIAAVLVAAIVLGVWRPWTGKKAGETQINGNLQSDSVSATDILQSFSELNSVSVGDHFTFGSYPQSTDDPEPIEWRVLNVEDGKALIISEYVLDCHIFDEESALWETSSIRYWLNHKFFNSVFSDSEKERILLASIKDAFTEDYVFCLNHDEADKYFIDSDDRMAATTNYAIKQGVGISYSDTLDNGMKTGRWWIRNPFAGNGYNVAVICENGSLWHDYVTSDYTGVRPVVLVSLSADEMNETSSTEQSVGLTEEIKPLSELGSVSVGDHFTFGKYLQNTKALEPIEWRVLNVENGKALVISEYLLDSMMFDESSSSWESSSIRNWMNHDFYENVFSDSEKERIVLVSNEDTNTEDYVFCLSIDEASEYFKGDTERMAALTYFAIKRGAWSSEEYKLDNGIITCSWWLRNPGSSPLKKVMIVGEGGDIYSEGERVSEAVISVRPALWLNL